MISSAGEFSLLSGILHLFPFWLCFSVSFARIHYVIPEELNRGAFVGNITKDLGTNLAKLETASLQVLSMSDSPYFSVNVKSGILMVNERVDREQLCGQTSLCVLNLKLSLENPVQVYHIEVEILDINDNPPRFQNNEISLKINELASPGARFIIQTAQDPDIGSNGLQTYHLSYNEKFSLNVKTRADGRKFPELVLNSALDRERSAAHHLVLTAEDGGVPRRSSTIQINVRVLDANDNHPVFGKSSYTAHLAENAPIGSLVIKLNATDLDEGANGEIEYAFSNHNSETLGKIFSINAQTGEIRIGENLDFEKMTVYEIDVEARDKGSPVMEEHCSVIVEIADVNDNNPEIILTTSLSSVAEDAPIGTIIAIINVKDKDSEENGQVKCYLLNTVPFTLRKDSNYQYTLSVSDPLDREITSRYNITIAAVDMGIPPLSAKKALSLNLSDINDNPPQFVQQSYEVFVTENNKVGQLLLIVSALDPDSEQNALLSYSILPNRGGNSSLTTLPFYVNSASGQVYATLPFDHERTNYFQFQVEAADAGSPSLSSRTTVHVFIVDKNDNAPVILFPFVGKDTVTHCKIPPSIRSNTLVSKISAADPDSGLNAWLSYHLIEATDPSLFSVTFRTGEIRTTRVLHEQDYNTHKLILKIKDSGEPPMSALLTVLISVEDVLEVSQALTDQSTHNESISSLTLYLIISLVIISMVSLTALVVLGVQCLRCNTLDKGNSVLSPVWLWKTQEETMDTGTHLSGHFQHQSNLGDIVRDVQVGSSGNTTPSRKYRSCFSPVSEVSEFTFMKPSTFDTTPPCDILAPDSTFSNGSYKVRSKNKNCVVVICVP